MVKICKDEYPRESEEKYKEYFNSFPYELSNFQKHGIEGIIEGNHILITAHTGSGKTLPAEFAIKYFSKLGKKIIYTSPIKALSNQKYYEFSNKYPDITFGLFTGDIKTNPDATVLIMTAEILMNYLYSLNNEETTIKSKELHFQLDIKNDLACVIMDEIHYINDPERGNVWEQTILMLPPHVQMIMLSATIDSPEKFAQWCERDYTDKQVYLASTNKRIVPLTHYGFLANSEGIYKAIRDKEKQQNIRNITNRLIKIQSETGTFQESGYNLIYKTKELLDNNRVFMNKSHVLNSLAGFLKNNDMLPAIFFVFSRRNVEQYASEITTNLLEDDSKIPYIIRKECKNIICKLPNYQEYLELPEYNKLISLLEKGIGIHHSGMIPILREIVELMISKKYIKILFATESFSIGLDCPIKTAVFTSIKKFDGNTSRYLLPHEYTQLGGRAGRRGIDTVGYIVHCNNFFDTPTMSEYKNIMCGIPQKLVSKFHISFSLILNLIKNGKTSNFHEFIEKSLLHKEIMREENVQEEKILNIQYEIDKINAQMKILKTPYDECEKYNKFKKSLPNLINKKKKEAEREIAKLTDKYKYITTDALILDKLDEITYTARDEVRYLKSIQDYVRKNTDNICKILIDSNFIERIESNTDENNSYKFMQKGHFASEVSELHPLIVTDMVIDWNYMADFSPKQLVGLFSCFTDIKINPDIRSTIPNSNDYWLKEKINYMNEILRKYQSMEDNLGISTGIKYDEILVFDIIDESMEWCDLDNEKSCKYFIQTKLKNKEISIGDFTKAMLKISTITKELISVCEKISQISLMHKLSKIDGMILKYITTTQSLYV